MLASGLKRVLNVGRLAGACTRSVSSTPGPGNPEFHDPPYLKDLQPKIPIYPLVNIQITSYDFALAESYQKLVHKLAWMLDINVNDGWATPATRAKIMKFKPFSSTTDAIYELDLYERNIQVADLPSTKASLLLDLIQEGMPQGVNVSVHAHEPEHSQIRYVPDLELKELKTKLEEMAKPKKK